MFGEGGIRFVFAVFFSEGDIRFVFVVLNKSMCSEDGIVVFAEGGVGFTAAVNLIIVENLFAEGGVGFTAAVDLIIVENL